MSSSLQLFLLPIVLVLVLTVCIGGWPSAYHHNVTKLPLTRSLWYIGTPEFFLRPVRFLEESITRSKGSIFTFRVMNNNVMILRGMSGRDAFFSKGLDFMAGYRLLNPQLVDVMPVTEISGDQSWAGFMAHFIRSEVLEQLYPIMIGDISRTVRRWGKQGVVDPFTNVYEVIFALSMRLGTCNEWCEDPKNVTAMMRIFADLEAGSKPTSILLPWIPTPSRVRRLLAGGKLYSMINSVVAQRKKQDRREDDPLQVLIDKKFSLVEITRFVAMILFAAVTNTGNVFCWLLIYLEVNQKWKTSVQDEIAEFIRANRTSSTEDVSQVLTRAGMEALDEATPILTQCIDEALRIIFNGTFMRRNIGQDLMVDGTCVSQGTFLMFPTGDLHYDEKIFPDPYVFDPTRFAPEGIEARKTMGIHFLGWGAGRHVCVGKRAATIMMKSILALMVGTLEMEVVDEKGVRLETIPCSRRDMLFKVCPSKEKVGLRYRERSMQDL